MEMMAFNPLKITEKVRAMIRSGTPDPALLAEGRAHYNLGGIMTDVRAETTLKNLYAAGEVADGLLGAARLGGTALADAIVFGTIAGREAGSRAARVERQDDLGAGMAGERERIGKLTGGTSMPPLELQKAVKSVMWESAGMAKTEQSLTAALKKLKELKLLAMKVDPADPKGVGQAIEAHLMACVGELIVVSTLQRRETRGQFWRLDYPASDNARCLFNVVLSRRGDAIDIRTKKPVMTRMRTVSETPLVGCGCFNYLAPKNGG